MRNALCISRKEFNTYFTSPIAYIVIAVFLLVTGWFFFSTFFLINQASLRNFFGLLPTVFAFVVPAVTMRLFAEEFHIGSFETLLTLPVRGSDVILGKFLAAVAFIAAMLAQTLSYAVMVAWLGTLDWGPVLGGYLGAVFLGAAFAAIGLFASALTRNQIVAFIIGLAICFSLTVVDQMVFFLPRAFVPALSAEALIATAIGLFAAIPAVVAYNRYSHDIDRLAIRFESFMEEFSNILQRQAAR